MGRPSVKVARRLCLARRHIRSGVGSDEIPLCFCPCFRGFRVGRGVLGQQPAERIGAGAIKQWLEFLLWKLVERDRAFVKLRREFQFIGHRVELGEVRGGLFERVAERGFLQWLFRRNDELGQRVVKRRHELQRERRQQFERESVEQLERRVVEQFERYVIEQLERLGNVRGCGASESGDDDLRPMGLVRGMREQLVYDQWVLQRDMQDLFERREQRLGHRLVQQFERSPLWQLERGLLEQQQLERGFQQLERGFQQLERGFQQLERRRFVRVLSAGADFRGTDRVGVTLLGLLHAGVRMDGQRRRRLAGHELFGVERHDQHVVGEQRVLRRQLVCVLQLGSLVRVRHTFLWIRRDQQPVVRPVLSTSVHGAVEQLLRRPRFAEPGGQDHDRSSDQQWRCPVQSVRHHDPRRWGGSEQRVHGEWSTMGLFGRRRRDVRRPADGVQASECRLQYVQELRDAEVRDSFREQCDERPLGGVQLVRRLV